MEELFFAALIGTVHIDSVIPYILRMDSTEYNGQFGKKKSGTKLLLTALVIT